MTNPSPEQDPTNQPTHAAGPQPVDSAHPTGDELLDHALGAPLPAHHQDHLACCARCTGELARWQATLTAARTDATLSTAPTHVWDAIAAATGTDLAATTPDPDSSPADRQPSVTKLHHERARRRPRAPWATAVAAAAAGIAIGITATLAVTATRDDADPRATPAPSSTATAPAAVQAASTPLRTLDTKTSLGTATLEDDGQARQLDITTTGLHADGGYLEVWLINRDGTRMVSIGVLPNGTGRHVFPLPADLLDHGYTTVDISHEAMDDKPTHSGDSLVRGTLTTRGPRV